MRDADNPQWPSGTPGQLSKVCSTVPSKNNNSQSPLRDLRRSLPFTVSLVLIACWLMLVAELCGPAATAPRLTTTSTTLTTIYYSCSLTSTLRQPLLASLSEVDVLCIALGCRLALVIFTASQQYCPSPDLEPPPFEAVLEPLL